jgi:hypothetical protein
VHRRFVWRRFVEETFCRGDVLYVRRIFLVLKDSREREREWMGGCRRRMVSGTALLQSCLKILAL